MSRRLALGMRGRLTAALVLTSALTLVVVAVALLAPLERRLRSDAVRALTETTLAARPTLAELPARHVRRNSPAVRAAVDDIRRRTGAEVAAVDARGHVIAAGPPRAAERYDDVVKAVAGERTVAAAESAAEGAEARVAVPVRLANPAYGLSLRRPLRSLERANRVVRRSFLLAALVAMAAALAVGGMVPRRLVRRLNALRESVLRVDDASALSEACPDDARDEVGDLARAFAAMRRRVGEQERARRTFVSTASHELRTPLTSLQLMLGMLGEDLRDDAPDLTDARDQVARAAAQAARLTRLAGDLLDVSRLDAAVPLRAEPVDLRELARAVIAEFDGARIAAVELEPPAAGASWALADPGGVAQVLRILVDNALGFAPAGTVVTVSLSRRGGRCRVAVRDRGPGVAEADVERIFERFERGHQAPQGGGFGLGLAIGRELARRMGGDLVLASRRYPTRFLVELPLPPAEPASAAARAVASGRAGAFRAAAAPTPARGTPAPRSAGSSRSAGPTDVDGAARRAA